MAKPSLRPLLPGIIAASVILSAAMGARQTFGLFVEPYSMEHHLPVTVLTFALALHNLVWGFAQPFAGAAADRFGAPRVVAVGAVLYAGGLAVASHADNQALVVIGIGLMVGIGISCTTFGVVLTSLGRLCTPEQRSLALGIASAGGSVGQVGMVPLAQYVTSGFGPNGALLALALAIFCALPFGLLLDSRDAAPAPALQTAPPLGEALHQAMRHRSFRLLTLGFFACGFQLAFIATHLPGYLSLCHMPIGLGATALAAIGLFNMGGSWLCGWLGGRFRQQNILGWLYLLRAVIIIGFFLLPKSPAIVMTFASLMGLLWLGTVPLTSGLIAKMFGTRHLGTLFGVVFFSHQIGSFLGAWSGGAVLAATGSYGPVWIATALTGIVAAMLHFPIDDKPRTALTLVEARA